MGACVCECVRTLNYKPSPCRLLPGSVPAEGLPEEGVQRSSFLQPPVPTPPCVYLFLAGSFAAGGSCKARGEQRSVPAPRGLAG